MSAAHKKDLCLYHITGSNADDSYRGEYVFAASACGAVTAFEEACGGKWATLVVEKLMPADKILAERNLTLKLSKPEPPQ